MSDQKKDQQLKKKLVQEARRAAKLAHAPYSHAHIGAALLTNHGDIFSGCNIENSSYGATICAERVAIFKAISQSKKTRIVEICVVSPGEKAWPPCGMCRQVLSEFAGPDLKIHIATHQGPNVKTFSFAELFPHAFESKFLKNLKK